MQRATAHENKRGGATRAGACRLARHAHEEALLVLGLRGVLTIETPDSVWTVPPETALWVAGGMPHDAHTTEDHESRVLLLDSRWTPPELAGQSRLLRVSSLVREVIERALTLPADSARRDHLVSVLVDEVAAAPVVTARLVAPCDEGVRRVTDALLRAPSSATTVAEWSRIAGFCERTFRDRFHAEMGVSFAEWRQQLLVEHATRRLEAGDSVKRVAADLGYRSPSAFIAMFKRATSAPPQRFVRARKP